MPSLHDKICESGASTLAEYLCIPCKGGGGGEIIGVDVPVNINPLSIEMEVQEDENIEMSIEQTSLQMSISEITIGVNINPTNIESKIKEC